MNLRDPKQSAVQGRILADDCRAALVKSNEHELWTASADFFAQFVSADKEWRAVYESGLSLDNSTLLVLLTLHYLLAASLAEPAKAFQLHMAVLGALEQHMAQYGFPSRDLYRLLLPALVIDTWKTKLDEKPFHFGLLPYLRREFSALQNMPRGVGLMKTVLRLVAVGLNAQVKPPQRLWLDSDKSTDLV